MKWIQCQQNIQNVFLDSTGFRPKKLIIKTKKNLTSGTTDVFGNSIKHCKTWNIVFYYNDNYRSTNTIRLNSILNSVLCQENRTGNRRKWRLGLILTQEERWVTKISQTWALVTKIAKKDKRSAITIAVYYKLYIVCNEARSIGRWFCLRERFQEKQKQKKIKTARLQIFPTLIPRSGDELQRSVLVCFNLDHWKDWFCERKAARLIYRANDYRRIYNTHIDAPQCAWSSTQSKSPRNRRVWLTMAFNTGFRKTSNWLRDTAQSAEISTPSK